MQGVNFIVGGGEVGGGEGIGGCKLPWLSAQLAGDPAQDSALARVASEGVWPFKAAEDF